MYRAGHQNRNMGYWISQMYINPSQTVSFIKTVIRVMEWVFTVQSAVLLPRRVWQKRTCDFFRPADWLVGGAFYRIAILS